MGVWHTYSTRQTLSELETDKSRGLSGAEAERRLARWGPNRLEEGRRQGLLLRFLGQMKDPMILVLLAAAALSLWASGGEDWLDAAIILVIVVVNACISISQEDSAEKALEALRKMSAPLAKVVRDGALQRLETDRLVPGDIIHLEAGDLVPADARILEAASLQADESAMTGESVPVSKGLLSALPEDTPLAERHNMVLASTVITRGRAVCVVTGTGMDTEVGRIAGLLLGEGEGQTPLQKKMAEISKTLSFVCLCVCAVMFGVGLLQGRPMLDMFLTAVSLAVAAIPEGLPAIVTIVLALGVARMARRRAIVKRLPAVETLGCAGVICSDKTGTLTQNRMTVVDVWTPRSGERALALTIGALCSDAALAWKGREPVSTGDPTETALVDAAAREGLDKNGLEGEWPRRGELPFDSERKLMTTVHQRPGGGWRVCVKGAPDVLARRCRLDSAAARRLESRNEAMAGKALRVLGVAYKESGHAAPGAEQRRSGAGTHLRGTHRHDRPAQAGGAHSGGAVLRRGHQAGHDHRRPQAHRRGHRPGAKHLPPRGPGPDGERSGLSAPGGAGTGGGEVLRLCPGVPRAQDAYRQGVAGPGKGGGHDRRRRQRRPRPQGGGHRLRHGGYWNRRGQGAADMILTDDNFATIVSAVEQGRGIYANIKKAIHYLLSCNIGEILTIFCATVFHFHQMPLVPVQLLWLNLVTDSLPALALGVEPVEEGVMSQPPRDAHASLFAHGFAFRLAWQGVMVGLLTLAAYFLGEYVLSDPGEAHAAANTMAFATLTLCQLFHAFDVRSERSSLFHIGVFSNPAMNKAFLIGLTMQLAVLCVPPLQVVFSTVPMSPLEWAVVLALAITPVVVCELAKAVSRGRTRRPARAEKVEPACARR